MMCKLSADKISLSSLVQLTNRISQFNFFQSSEFGCFAHVHNTAMVGLMSGLACLEANNPFATNV
jgi:hypothetical protein